MTRKEWLQALLGGAAALLLLWGVTLLAFSFGDEMRQPTAPYAEARP